MITRMKMPRQLRNRGGIMTIGGGGYTGIPMGSRTGFGLISKVKDRVRKLIPNELANVAVKAAPLVAMIPGYGPTTAALMRGIGRFDQRGSLSDALKQGIGTYVGGELFGAGMEKIGLRDPGAKGIGEFFGEETRSKAKTLFKGDPKPPIDGKERGGLETVQKGVDFITDKAPILKKLPDDVAQKLLVGGAIAGASALYSYFTGEFEPQQPGETMGEYLARRDERVKQQMRGYMDSYYTPLRNPQYAAMSDEEKNNFIDGIVGQGMATGGRVGYQTGGITMANTLAENIARNRANQAAFQQSIAPARQRVKEQITKTQRTPIQEYAMSDDSILGPLSKKAASTIMAGQDKSQAALDVLNQTMTPTKTTDTSQAIRIGSGDQPNYDNSSKIYDMIGGAELYRSPDGYEIKNKDGQFTALGGKGESLADFLSSGVITEGSLLNYQTPAMADSASANLLSGFSRFIANDALQPPGSYNYIDNRGNIYTEKEYADLKNIDQTGMPKAITQDDIDTYNFTRANLPSRLVKLLTPPVEPTYSYITETGEPASGPGPNIGRIANYKPLPMARAPIPKELLMAGFEDYIADNPDAMSGMGITAMVPVTLPGGYEHEFSGSTEANAFNKYLESIGQPSWTRRLPQFSSSREANAYNKYLDKQLKQTFEEDLGDFGPDGIVIDGKKYYSQKEAIADMGIERYNMFMSKGGRVGFNSGSNGLSKYEIFKLKELKYDVNKYGADHYGGVKVLREILDLHGYNQGGRVGLMGGAMPTGIMRTNKAGVMERDYRDKGGFVPVGIKEKADDVPAMLSKNEFVFTADAVRGAGNGSIEKGAQKMYDTMKNLERRVV
jgi:hypothetical protein